MRYNFSRTFGLEKKNTVKISKGIKMRMSYLNPREKPTMIPDITARLRTRPIVNGILASKHINKQIER
ncbi:MAG: hypothetical protein U9N73_11880, partial [Candidatus Auribacterota bacterium]|nr:hypothetical protein [Candidatus Auribacterota bacterium]